MDELSALGTLFLTLSGGEVFLRADIFALLDYARLRRFSVKIITNGTYLDAPAVKALAHYPVYQVGVSVYSLDPTIHDAMTAHPGSLDKTRRAVEMLAQAGMNVMVKTLITRLNAATYPAVAAWADSLGPRVQRQFDMLVTPRNDGVYGPAGLNLDARWRAAFIAARVKEMRDTRRVEELERKAGRRRRGDMPCFAGQSGAYIGPSGVVYPCIDWHLPCGNVTETPFAGIWRGSAQLKFARGFSIGRMKACAACDLLNRCSLCPGLNLMERGDPAKPAPLVCARTRAFVRMDKKKR
jgi:radical SAM protein with 4Fe4S-binding SPASM domain